ncbi:MAG TPA: PLP-dependent transferase, partial [Trebonia sp.]|nr:PLP-dependent transferase [Trebonia sp.]
MDFSVEARIVHAGSERAAGAPLAPPLLATSTYVSQGEPDPARGYGRMANPGWAAVEDALGAIEDARAVTFPSGQAASMALMLALADGGQGRAPERIVFPGDGYYNTLAMAARLRPHGAEAVAVDLLDLAAVERAVRERPAVLWAETPTNPLLRVADLRRLAAIAAGAGAALVVDNTVATGLLQKPLDLGAVASVYSLTKSISGHSDVLGGAVVTRDEGLAARVRDWRTAGGAIPGPFESWLVLRGLKTLPLRLERQCANAAAIARYLAGHRRVAAVHYPGMTPATADVARAQMPAGSGPLLSFELAGAGGGAGTASAPGTAAEADAVIAAARLIVPATSFGGVESTWERRARWAAETAPPALIRLSAGIEPAGDLLADLDHSLASG